MYPSVIDVGLYSRALTIGCTATAINVKGPRVNTPTTTFTYPPSFNITLQKNTGALFVSSDYTGIVTMYSDTTTTGTYDDSTYAPFAVINFGIGFYGYGLFEQWRILDQYAENIPVKVYWDSYSELGSNGIMYRTRTATKLSSSAFDWSAYSGFKSAINTNCCTMVGNYVNIEFLFYANKWSSTDYLNINDTFYDLKTFQKNTYIKAQEFNSCFLRTGLFNMLPQGTLSVVPTTGIYDLGSTSALWDSVHVDKVYFSNINNYKRWELVSAVEITTSTYSIEVGGLDFENDKTYLIQGHFKVNTCSSVVQLRFNTYQTNTTPSWQSQSISINDSTTSINRYSAFTEIALTSIFSQTSCRADCMVSFNSDKTIVAHLNSQEGMQNATWLGRKRIEAYSSEPYQSNVTQLYFYNYIPTGSTFAGRFVYGTSIQIWRAKSG